MSDALYLAKPDAAPKFVDDALGPKPATKYVDDALGPRAVTEPTIWDGAFADEYFSQQSPGKILDMFGQGLKQGWGEAASPVSPATEKWMKDKGVWGDYEKGTQNVLRSFNEGLMRSTAAATDLFLRSGTALYHGAAETLAPVVPRDILAIPEAFMGDFPGHAPHIASLRAAHDLGLTEEIAPGITPREAARTSMSPTGEPSRTERVILPELLVTPDNIPSPLESITDVHELARRLAPDTFTEYDTLAETKNQYMGVISELDEARTQATGMSPEAQQVQKTLDAESSPRRRERLQKQLDAQIAHDDAIAKERIDSLRSEMNTIDAQMRDLSPAVSAAYRDARDRLPAPPEPATAPNAPDVAVPAIEPTPSLTPPEIYNLLQRRPTIAADVTRQLIAAGRPEEEARASAALVQAHYEARAARFNGALGSARDLYESEDPIIQGGEGKQRGRLDLVRNQITLFKDADASTFIHESAHNWLEEMLRDSQHEAAPTSLKEDVQTVRDWLGAEGSITRAQHERFARGFERYLMEGIAPSTRLAQVFAKFKDWLTQIYQRVGQLRSPINDQIRGVYDRLLAPPRDEPVIAPEREVAQNFADVHEHDAATATPENALRRADEIAAEREQIAQIMRAEIMNGRRRARAERSGRSTEATGIGDRISEGTRPEGAASIREETSAEPSAISPSGAKFKAKEDIPDGPHENFGASDGRLIDKSGELRLDNVEAPEDVDAAIREKAGGGRGIATDGQLLDLAYAIGLNPAFFDHNAARGAFTAEEIRAGTEMLVQADTDVRDKMLQAAESGDPLELAQAIARLEMIQGKLSGQASMWGYAGHALRALKEFTGGDLATLLRENTGRSIDQLMQMARLGSRLKTPQQVANFIYNTRGATHPIVFYYWNALISGPLTHAVYFAGNMLRAVAEPLLEVPIAATIGAIRSEADRVYFREFNASVYGLIKGFQDSLPAARDAFILGQQIPLPGQRGYGNAFGTFTSPIPGPVGYALGVPGRSVSAIHQLGMGIRYEQGIQRLAVRSALEKNLSGQAFDIEVGKLTNAPTKAMMDEAGQKALTEMYMRPTEFNSLSAALTRTAHKTVVGQILLPFIKIGVELQRETWVKHTPVGMLDKEVRNQLLMRDGGASFDDAAAKQLIGIGMLGTGVAWTAQGLLTGFGPPDPNQRREWLMNHQPYSVQIGNLQIPYQGLGPIGKLLQFGADSYEAVHFWDGEQASKLATNYMKAIARAALDESIFRDMTDMHEAINNPSEHAARWLYNFVPGWLPYSSALGQINRRFFDPYSKDVADVFDAIKAKVPFWSWQVPDRYDTFGQSILARGVHWNRYADDPTVQHLDRLGVKVGRLDKKINGVDLTHEQQGDYARNAGIFGKQLLDEALADPRGLQTAPHGVQLMEINRLLEGARSQARALIKMQSIGTDNDLVAKGVELKRKALE